MAVSTKGIRFITWHSAFRQHADQVLISHNTVSIFTKNCL
jgi:hypothetical protein